MAYISERDKNRNYQAEIDDAVAKGDYALASSLEADRNQKIDAEGLYYDKTNNYSKPAGVSDATYNAMNAKYKDSDKQAQLDENVKNASTRYNDIVSSNPISKSTEKALDSNYRASLSIKKADRYLAEQLEIIQSGKTSYSDQVRDMLDQIMNREKFSYDMDTDPLFQQALASAMNSGKQAMQDTMGQASALTGGYGSTYATSAANQTYNEFIEGAYDDALMYYQAARDTYQMEGEQLYQQYGMLSTEDEKEYSRNLTAYDATAAYRNQLYNEEYGQYRDEKSDAFSNASLELDIYGQKVNNALNSYNMEKDMAETEYQRNYNSWLDAVNIAMQQGQAERGAYEYDKSFDESVRQYEQNFAEQQRQHNAEMEYKWAALEQEKAIADAKIAADAANNGDYVEEANVYLASKKPSVQKLQNHIEGMLNDPGGLRRMGVMMGQEADYVDSKIQEAYENGEIDEYGVLWLQTFFSDKEAASALNKKYNGVE